MFEFSITVFSFEMFLRKLCKKSDQKLYEKFYDVALYLKDNLTKFTFLQLFNIKNLKVDNICRHAHRTI